MPSKGTKISAEHRENISRAKRKWWREHHHKPRGRIYRWLDGKKGHRFWSVKTKNGHRVAEHRLIMARILRRKLQPNEYVRHRNGNRLDNRPENLDLFIDSERSVIFGLDGRWSRCFEQCISCGSRQSRHKGNGLCLKCYLKSRKEFHRLRA